MEIISLVRNIFKANVGVGTNKPDCNIQVGQHDNDAPVPAPSLEDAEICIYSGTATNNGTSTLGLYESVPGAFPGDYGFRLRYDAATNLFEVVSVVAGVETVAFTFDRTTQLAVFSGNVIADDPLAPTHVTTLGYEDLRRDSVKVRNTATGNLNTGVATFNNFTTADELGSTLGQFTFATNGITPNFTGVAEVIFNIELIGTATRAVPGFRWLHNGANGPWVRHSYIRNSSGHTESSVNFTTQIPVTAGQPIQIQHDNFAGGGTVTSPANGVEFIVQRIR